jgi:hypothetical protein
MQYLTAGWIVAATDGLVNENAVGLLGHGYVRGEPALAKRKSWYD